MSTREIVTLQIGHYSNFVGTHWWNLQESSFVYDPSAGSAKEVDHDVLFREGSTQRGEVTFTPRLVVVDLYNSLGSLRQEGSLYDVSPSEDNVKWRGDVTLHQAELAQRNRYLEDLEKTEETKSREESPREDGSWKKSKEDESCISQDLDEELCSSKNEDNVFGPKFYNLDKDVKVWSDFLRTGLHPKSIHLIPDYQHNNPTNPFEVFGEGLGCVRGDQREALEDRVRFFVEECDQLQGFHILFDNHNAFGGVSASLLTHLADEYSGKVRLTFAVTPGQPPDGTAKERSTRIINSALSLHGCGENSSLFVPVSLATSLWKAVGGPVNFPKLNYKAGLDYHTSAIVAASLDTASLPYRKASDSARLWDITGTFSSRGRKVAALNSSFPYVLNVEDSFANSLVSLGSVDPWHSLTPHVQCTSAPVFQSCVLRGVPDSMLTSRKKCPAKVMPSCGSLEEVLRLYLAETYPSSHNASCVVREAIQVGSPFPHIFTEDISRSGLLMDTHRPALCGVNQAPVMTSLQSSPDLAGYVDSLTSCVSTFNISRHQHFLDSGLEPEEFSTMLEDLYSLGQCYR